MKRTYIIALVAAAVLVAASLVWFNFTGPPPGRVDAEKITIAVQTYVQYLKQNGLPVPQSVKLQNLVHKGLLRQEDVSGFDGVDVTIYLTMDETNPSQVLMRARFPDGSQEVVLSDGSVQQVSNKGAMGGRPNSNIRNNQ